MFQIIGRHEYKAAFWGCRSNVALLRLTRKLLPLPLLYLLRNTACPGSPLNAFSRHFCLMQELWMPFHHRRWEEEITCAGGFTGEAGYISDKANYELGQVGQPLTSLVVSG